MSSKREAIGGPKCGCEASFCGGDNYVAKARKEKPKKLERASSQRNRPTAGATQPA